MKKIYIVILSSIIEYEDYVEYYKAYLDEDKAKSVCKELNDTIKMYKVKYQEFVKEYFYIEDDNEYFEKEKDFIEELTNGKYTANEIEYMKSYYIEEIELEE